MLGVDYIKSYFNKLNEKKKKNKHKYYQDLDNIPVDEIDGNITKGCLVLEGGSFRGLYTSGVLDCLMLNGINLETTIGVSAGSLNGINYAAGQIGRSAKINLKYRHDRRYMGIKPILKDRGVIGFNFMFSHLDGIPDIKLDNITKYNRRYLAVCTSLKTGRAKYAEYGKVNDIFPYIKASSTLPFVSLPVQIGDDKFMDGGCSVRVPYKWAINNDYEKIIVVRTRPKGFRCNPNYEKMLSLTKRTYPHNLKFAINLAKTDLKYNKECDELDKLEEEGRIFSIYPSKPINTKTLEGDMEKLGDAYLLGYNDCLNLLPTIKEYLSK